MEVGRVMVRVIDVLVMDLEAFIFVSFPTVAVAAAAVVLAAVWQLLIRRYGIFRGLDMVVVVVVVIYQDMRFFSRYSCGGG